VKADGTVEISVDVTNQGPRDGDEVVQLYVSHAGVPGAPLRALQRFERVHLKREETRRMAFTLDARALSVVGEDGVRRVSPGGVQLWIGGGQPEGRPGLPAAPGVAAQLEVSGSAVLPK
jgi:beta-glucosidase